MNVAIVGLGPRGIAVLERLAVHLRSEPHVPVRLHLIDADNLGGGRIWRADQEPWFLMNTIVGELTLFSGPAAGRTCRPGAGCSFHEWLRGQEDPELAGLGADEYAPRYAYGGYLRHVYQSVLVGLPSSVEVVETLGRAVALRRGEGGYRLEIRSGGGETQVDAEAVVLTTGHGQAVPDEEENRLADFASRSRRLRYIRGDNPSDMALGSIAPGTEVGLVGLGLSFYDIVLSLTVGRGGEFKREPDGRLVYVPSGDEPLMVGGSRSGMLIAVRGRNEKQLATGFRPRFLSRRAIAERRSAASRHTGRAALDFDRDVLPLLLAEVNHVYYTTHARQRLGPAAAERLATDLQAAGEDLRRWHGIVASHGLDDVPMLDLERLARPFATMRFADPDEFEIALRVALNDDLRAAQLGNVDGPLKAAIDVFREARELIRAVVETAGLRPESHREAFLGRFFPVLALLSTGPPLVRTEQFLALLDSGVVRVVGPNATFLPDERRGLFAVASPQVAGSRRYVEVLIDARIPRPDLCRHTDSLFRGLAADGVAAEFTNTDGTDSFRTGGIAVTPAEHRVVSATGVPQPTLYALGIPTEGAKWFTQIGNGRPGTATSFHRDVEAVVLSLLRRCGVRRSGGHTRSG